MKKPFVGLRPFREAENDLFFGRTLDIGILQNLILAVPVLVVYAPSGTGKSSLISAGALPVIDQDPTLLSIVLNDPRADVLHTVRAKLASTGWAVEDKSESYGLAKTLERHLRDTDRRVILILDQFEERLNQSGELEALYAEIARLANTRTEAATVVISIREDYLAGLEPLMRRVTGLLDASFRVPSLSRGALTEAVYGPLKAVSPEITIDNGLVDEVLTDLERETHITESLDGRIEAGYFQIVWSHLWDEDSTGPQHRLTRKTYRREGSAAGILKSFVSGTLGQLLPFEAEILRAVTRYMVLPTGAKVALTIDDLLGLLRTDDFTAEGNALQLFADKKITQAVLDSVFHQLTRTEAPLFRRVMRGQREEFELVHDLLGLILLQWRLHYRAKEWPAAGQTAKAIFRADDTWHEPDTKSLRFNQPIEESALSRLRSLGEALRRYTRSLKDVKTVIDAEQQGEALRSAFSEVRDLGQAIDTMRYSYEARGEMRNTIDSPISTTTEQLTATAVYHRSREVCRVLQQQAYELLALKGGLLGDSSYYDSSISRGVVGWIATVAVGLVSAVGGIAIARWLIEQIWHVPDLQYVPLTLAVVACGATLLYFGTYVSKAPRDLLRWSAIRKTLWPTVSFPEKPEGNWQKWAGYLAVFAWWPIIFVVFELVCSAAAAGFHLAGWSPTAGFNLAALAAAIGATILYGWSADW